MNWTNLAYGGGPHSRGGFFNVGYQSAGGTVNVKSGAQLNANSGTFAISGYANSGAANFNIDGANSAVNNSGALIGFGTRGAATATANLNITNGGAWIESTPYSGPNQQLGNTTRTNTITVNGANSKFQVTDNTKIQINNGTIINVQNGGLVDFSGGIDPATGSGVRGQGDTQTNVAGRTTQITVDGAGSVLNGGRQWNIAGIGRGSPTGASINRVINGGELTATGYNGASVIVHDRGILELDNGTVRVGFGLTGAFNNATGLRLQNNTSVPDSSGLRSTLRGNGTIIQRATAIQYEALEVDAGTRVAPGLNGPGTITIQGGSMVVRRASATNAELPAASLDWELSTTAGNPHDSLQLTTAGENADVNVGINYIDFGIGDASTNPASGYMDFLIAGDIDYGLSDLTASAAGTDIPGTEDNLDDILALKGYTPVTGASPTSPGQYRYYLLQDAPVNDSGVAGLDVLRLEFAPPVPEPTALSLIGLGGLALLRRRRRTN
jgi:hypothetical protein